MATTEHERLELYELAKHEVGDRFAELLMDSLPHDPDELVRKTDLDAVEQRLDTSIDSVRTELKSDLDAVEQRLDAKIGLLGAELRTDLSTMRVEMRDLTSTQTRTMMLGLVGSITALTITQIVVSAIG